MGKARARRGREGIAGEAWRPSSDGGDGPKSVRRVLREFTGKSTLHGIAHAAAARTPRGRLFWFTLFVLCISLLAYQLSITAVRFLRYEKIVQVEVRYFRVPSLSTFYFPHFLPPFS